MRPERYAGHASRQTLLRSAIIEQQKRRHVEVVEHYEETRSIKHPKDLHDVCIIGHGRSPEGKGWSRIIDQTETVIRMWDWHWQDRRDYGRRYTYGLFEVHHALVAKFQRYNRAEPERGWIGSILTQRLGCPIPERTEVFGQDRWTAEGQAMGGHGVHDALNYTRGTLAALWAIDHMPKGGDLVLVGFDNVLLETTLPLEQAFNPRYRAAPSTFSFGGYKPGERRQGNHDFGIEKLMMLQYGKARKVNVWFAQEVW